MTGGLTGAMLREHRWPYAGLAVIFVAASTVVGSSFILFEAARTTDIDVSGLGANEAAKLIVLAKNGRFISSFMAVLGSFVAVLLVSQTMSFVVDGRRRELALLRLAGASPSTTVALVTCGRGLCSGSAVPDIDADASIWSAAGHVSDRVVGSRPL